MSNQVIQFSGVRAFLEGQLSAATSILISRDGQIVPTGEITQTIRADGCWLLPALTALCVDFQEPARDDIYTLRDGFEAMRRGGFQRALTESAANPIDNGQKLKAVQEACRETDLEIYHLGALSVGHEHKALAEMLELAQGGVVGFGDGNAMPTNLRFLRRVMEYASVTGKRIFIQPTEPSLAYKGVVHEGAPADCLGMKGIPRAAEIIAVHQVIELSKWLNVPVHLKQISCAESLELLARARERGADVTADVSVYHLLMDESCLHDLDPNTYLLPPLRTAADREALWRGLDEGLISAISCAHTPILQQDKLVNFEDAVPGAISLEIAFTALRLPAEQRLKTGLNGLLKALTEGPAKIMGIPTTTKTSHWFLFDPNRHMTITPSVFAGQVCNSPLLGKTLPGTVMGTLFNGVWRNNPWSA